MTESTPSARTVAWGVAIIAQVLTMVLTPLSPGYTKFTLYVTAAICHMVKPVTCHRAQPSDTSHPVYRRQHAQTHTPNRIRSHNTSCKCVDTVGVDSFVLAAGWTGGQWDVVVDVCCICFCRMQPPTSERYRRRRAHADARHRHSTTHDV